MVCGSGHGAFVFNQRLLVTTVANGVELTVVVKLCEWPIEALLVAHSPFPRPYSSHAGTWVAPLHHHKLAEFPAYSCSSKENIEPCDASLDGLAVAFES